MVSITLGLVWNYGFCAPFSIGGWAELMADELICGFLKLDRVSIKIFLTWLSLLDVFDIIVFWSSL